MTTPVSSKMHIEGVWHFSFTVSDMEQSIAFYRDLLGFTLVHTQEQTNPYISRLVGYPDAHLKVAQFAVPAQPRNLSNHDFELVEYVNPRGQRGDTGPCNPGAGHLCLAVPNIDEAYDYLTKAGVRFTSSPNAIEGGSNIGGYTCYFWDPDDIMLEILQPPPHVLAELGSRS